MARSEITIDLGALRRNVRRLRAVLAASELWAVVKADGYGHGALDCARRRSPRARRALCVATRRRGARAARRAARGADPRARAGRPTELARGARGALELVVGERIPEGLPVHVKLDTGMGRWGVSELPRRRATSSG